MTTFGKQALSQVVPEPLSALAGAMSRAKWKEIGVVIDWSTVTAVSGSDVKLIDGTLIPIGKKYLRYGTIMAEITVGAEVQTFTISGGPTTGTWTLALTRAGVTATTDPIAIGASAADVLLALESLSNAGPGYFSVARSGSTPNFAYAVTAAGPLADENLALMAVANTFGGGTSPTVTPAATTNNTTNNQGYYGPADTGASDGRQTLTRSKCGILPFTVLEHSPYGLDEDPSQYQGLLVGGSMWEARLLVSGATQAPFSNFPTLANVLAALPLVATVRE